MNQGSRRGPIRPANWPGMTRPVLWTSRSGRTSGRRQVVPRRGHRAGDRGDRRPVAGLRAVGVEAGRQLRPPREHDHVAGRVVVRRDASASGPSTRAGCAGPASAGARRCGRRACAWRSAGTRRGSRRGRRAWGRSCRAAPGRRRGRCRSPSAPARRPARVLPTASARINGSRCSIPSPSRPIAPAWRAIRREKRGMAGDARSEAAALAAAS